MKILVLTKDHSNILHNKKNSDKIKELTILRLLTI